MAYRIDVLIILFPMKFECMWDADSEKENEKLVILYFARDFFFFFCSSQFCPLKKNNMFTLNGAEQRIDYHFKINVNRKSYPKIVALETGIGFGLVAIFHSCTNALLLMFFFFFEKLNAHKT